MFIIKKEDIKEDIIIDFDQNVVYSDDVIINPFISFIDGKLEIIIKNKIIADKEIVEKIDFKEEYINRFKINK